MSRDFDHILKEINKQNKELHDIDSKISKDMVFMDKELNSLKKDIANIKTEVKNISTKIDLILEILNNFTLMVLEEEEQENDNFDNSNDYLDEFDTDDTWVPEDWQDEDD